MNGTATKQPENPISHNALIALIDSRFNEEQASLVALDAVSADEGERGAAIGRVDALIGLIAALPSSELALSLKTRALLTIFAGDAPWTEANPTTDHKLLRGILETLAARFGVDFPLDCQTGESA